MKVLFASNFPYLPQRTGGSESSTNDLCIALMAKGIKVGVMCSLVMFDYLWIKNRVSSKLTGDEFIKDSRLPYPVFRGYRLKDGIDEVIHKFKPDIVVVQAGSPFELVNSFSKRKVPVIYYARDVEFQRNTEELNINSHVGYIANSQFTAGKMQELLMVNSLVLPPLVDPDKYKVKSNRKFVLHIGLSQEKGIEISFLLASRRPDIPFIFIESWPISKEEFTNYEKRAATLNNVQIFRRTTDMKKYYGITKILLAPSICEEAWGRVVTEAQMNGIPVIASNRGGLPESLGSGGLVVPHDADIDEWEHALSELWDKPEIYKTLSEAAYERSQQEDISREVIIDKFINHLALHITSTSTVCDL